MDNLNEKDSNEEQSQPSLLGAVSRRFFFFTYSYWCEKTEGKGNLSLRSNQEFPKQNDIKNLAIKQVMDRYNEPEYKVKVVIDSWIEMSEDDYNNWLS